MKPWEVLESRLLFERRWLRLREDRVRLPNGAEIDQFHVLEYPDWAGVLALTRVGEVVLVEQYRHGIARASLELPAGVIDPVETALEAARRELLEETGYEAAGWTPLGRIAQDPSRHTHYAYFFFAHDARLVAPQQLDDEEHMAVHLVPAPEAVRLAAEGGIVHAAHLAAFFWARERGLL